MLTIIVVILIIAAIMMRPAEVATRNARVGAAARDKLTFKLVHEDEFLALDPEVMREYFIKRGYVEFDGSSGARPDAVWVEFTDNGTIPESSYKLRCRVKNLVDDHSHREITDKAMLHLHATPEDTYLMRSLDLYDKRLKMNGETMWIIRPSGRAFFKGHGIMRISTDAELRDARKFYEHLINKHRRTVGGTTALATQYMMNPVLFKGRKFHIRSYFLVRSHDRGWSLFPKFAIFTAARPYVADKWDDDDIHDTHIGSTERSIDYPRDAAYFEPTIDERSFREQHDYACARLYERVRHAIRPYPECEMGFEIFGIDSMITRDGRFIVIEVNMRNGYRDRRNDEAVAAFNSEILDWTMREGYDKMLKMNTDASI